jgi:hypothetical protein
MDLTSDQFTEEEVTDLVIGFPSGVVKDFVLHKADVFEDEPLQLRVVLEGGLVATLFPETLVFYKSHIAWYGTKRRILRRKVVGTSVADTKA